MIRKIAVLFVAVFMVLAVLPAPAVSAGGSRPGPVNPLEPVCDGTTSGASVCNADGSNPISGERGIIMRAVRILSYAIGVASVIMIMIGGLKFITSNGDSNSVASARNTVLYALIGVIVFLSSQLIIRFVISRL